MTEWRCYALGALLLAAAPASGRAEHAVREFWGTLVIEGAGDGVILSGPAAEPVRAELAQFPARARLPRAGRTLAEHLREYRWRAETAHDLELLGGQGPAAGFGPRF